MNHLDIIHVQMQTMIGDPVVLEVVRADLLRSSFRTDLNIYTLRNDKRERERERERENEE